MGYPNRMAAALPNNTVRNNGVNVNQIQYGNKLQGLPPVTGNRRPYVVYKSKAGGNAPDRFRVFGGINQLGGIGRGKNSQFASNADGLGWVPNRLNRNYGNYGLNIVDRVNNADRFQSYADQRGQFSMRR